MGRPPKTINWDQFQNLLSFQCSQEEICIFFGLHRDTLDKLCQEHLGETLSQVWDKRKFRGRTRLRQAQFQIVDKGGPGAATMAIFLDKKLMPEEQPGYQAPGVPHGTQAKGPVKKTFDEFVEAAGYPKAFAKQIEMGDFGFVETVPRLLLGSRGYGKTDYVTIIRTAYEIYSDWFDSRFTMAPLTETNLIITKAKPRAGAIINEIANALEANGVPLEKRNASCVRVEGLIGQNHSAEGITIKTSMRGRHPKRTIMDDPVTDEDVSEATRLQVERKYNEVMKLCTNVLIIGQPAHASDLYAKLRPLVKKLEVPFGSIPELDCDLDAQRLAGVDEKSIQASYFLKIIPDGTMPFQNIQYIDTFPLGDSVAFIDPSDGGDLTAISIGRAFVQGFAVHGMCWKMAWYHCLDEIIAICRAKGVRKVCFETNHTGTQPIDQLSAKFAPYGIGVVGKHSDSNKHACIMSAGEYAHHIFLAKDSDRKFIDYVVQYEYDSKIKDPPDSLARLLEWIGLVRGKR